MKWIDRFSRIHMNLFNLALRFWWFAKFWKNERTAADFGFIFLIILHTSNTRTFHVIQLIVSLFIRLDFFKVWMQKIKKKLKELIWILNNQWINNLKWKIIEQLFFYEFVNFFPLSWVIIKCKIKILRISNVVDILKIFVVLRSIEIQTFGWEYIVFQ